MKMVISGLILVSLIGIVVKADPQGWINHNNHYYYYSHSGDKPKPGDARPKCTALGADLLSIADQAEQTFINGTISTGYTIGLKTDETGQSALNRSNWCWTDDTDYNISKFHNWGYGYPINGFSQCGRLFNNGTWRSTECNGTSYFYICKKPDPCFGEDVLCMFGNCSVIHNETQYNCDCYHEYEGDNCDLDINECASNPCVNGICMDAVNGYTCNCTDTGFKGDHCETDINECETGGLICENDGMCNNTEGSAHCECVPGTTGMQCETEIDECQSNPCVNGTCEDELNGYICHCYPGFDGAECQTDINECEIDELICYYNSTCVNTPGSAYCDCVTGTTGEQCETDINECDSTSCINGTCQDRLGGFICDCISGYEGVVCDTDIDECYNETHECKNGTCFNIEGSYGCNCTEGFQGDLCEIFNATKIEDTSDNTDSLTTAFYASLGICIVINTGFLSTVIYFYVTEQQIKKKMEEETEYCQINPENAVSGATDDVNANAGTGTSQAGTEI